jgi:hypothetical protein
MKYLICFLLGIALTNYFWLYMQNKEHKIKVTYVDNISYSCIGVMPNIHSVKVDKCRVVLK